MDYINDTSVFDICEAHALLEANYNVGGWLRERPSNARRMESTGCQLARMGYSPGMRAVDLYAHPPPEGEYDACFDEDEPVRSIYFEKVIEWRLPVDDDISVIKRIFVPEFYRRHGEITE